MNQPERIGKYELRRHLGGGMSQVFEAWDPVIGRVVAVKILTDAGANDPDTKARFLREAQTAGGLSHDNIMRVYDFGEADGRPYMVMEFLRGRDLRDAIKTQQTGDIENRILIAHEIAKALEYIHTQDIVHRDVKPENVHLDQSGQVRLMDFGIAKRQELNLTRTGSVLGTPYYMAPEQIRGEEITGQADIYAFGILLFELCAGQRPISGETVEQIFYRILNERVDLEPLRLSGVPDAVVNLVERCTAKVPGDRPRSFAEVRRDLDGALEVRAGPERVAEPVAEPPVGRPSVQSRKWIVLVAAAAVLVIAAVSYLAFRPRTEPEPAPEQLAVESPEASLSQTLSTSTGEMVLVPAGEFLFGPDNQPTVLDPYYIDQTEVTNAAYAQYCEESGVELPPDFPTGKPDYPVVNVTFDEATQFAQWAGKRLPTAREWERAARGTDGRPYPWGSEHDPSRANVADAGDSDSTILPAVAIPLGASTVDALQMAGNVWEFVNERITPSPGALDAFAGLLSPAPTSDEPWYTMRGGSFDMPLIENVTYEWSAVPARFRAPNIGFRCVADAPQR